MTIDVWLAQTGRVAKTHRRELLGGLVGDRLDEFAAYEPDELVDRVWDQVDVLNPARLEREEAITEADEFVALMPRLWGGGAFYGQYGTENFALLAEAIDAGNPPPPATDLDDPDDDGEDAGLFRRQARIKKHFGRLRADRLAAILRGHRAGTTGDGKRIPARPSAYLTVSIETLLGLPDVQAGWLLTTLAGGRMKASAPLCRRIVDRYGVDLRLVVLDETGRDPGGGPGVLSAAWLAARRGDRPRPGRHRPRLQRADPPCDLDHRSRSTSAVGPTPPTSPRPAAAPTATRPPATSTSPAPATAPPPGPGPPATTSPDPPPDGGSTSPPHPHASTTTTPTRRHRRARRPARALTGPRAGGPPCTHA